MSEVITANGKKRNAIVIPAVGVGGVSLVAVFWWLIQSLILTPINSMEPRLQTVEKEQAVLSARVLTKLESMDDRLRNIERGQRWAAVPRPE